MGIMVVDRLRPLNTGFLGLPYLEPMFFVYLGIRMGRKEVDQLVLDVDKRQSSFLTHDSFLQLSSYPLVDL